MTNRLIREKWAWIEGSNMLRTGLIGQLTDDDLKFNPGGQNTSLGTLLRDFGNVEYAYVESLKTFKTDFSYCDPNVNLTTSVTALTAWFYSMDNEMKVLVSAFSDEDLKKPIGRSGDNTMPVETQIEVYLQALFIFFGKAVIYLRGMDRALSPSMQEWIA